MQQYASEISENKHFIDWNTDTLQICNMEQIHIHRSVRNNNDERPPCYVLLSELSVKSLFDAGEILNDCCYNNVSAVNEARPAIWIANLQICFVHTAGSVLLTPTLTSYWWIAMLCVVTSYFCAQFVSLCDFEIAQIDKLRATQTGKSMMRNRHGECVKYQKQHNMAYFYKI